MYVMGKASKMSGGPGALSSGKDHKENYSQSEGWEVEEERVTNRGVTACGQLYSKCLPWGCSRLQGAEGGGRHLYDVTGHDEGFLWETPQESQSETPRQAGAVWRLTVAIRDEWLHGYACLKLTKTLLASTALYRRGCGKGQKVLTQS